MLNIASSSVTLSSMLPNAVQMDSENDGTEHRISVEIDNTEIYSTILQAVNNQGRIGAAVVGHKIAVVDDATNRVIGGNSRHIDGNKFSGGDIIGMSGAVGCFIGQIAVGDLETSATFDAHAVA